jgi:Fe-S-cluster containining protein
LVPLFGHDLWLLSTRRNLAPESFAFVAEQETADPLGFRLTADGPTYGLALMKQEPIEASARCLFLEDAEPGRTRCGIYGDRPITCRSYPMSKLGDRLYQRERTLCPPGSWDDTDLLNPEWRETLQRLRRFRDIYVEVVARWNAAIEKWRPPGMLPPKLFTDYLMAVYTKVAELEASIGREALSELEVGWARIRPRPPNSEGELAVSKTDEPAWIAHLRRVRELIDGFFPELPPLPFQPVLVESGQSGG